MTSATIPRAAAAIPHIKNNPVPMLMIFLLLFYKTHTTFFYYTPFPDNMQNILKIYGLQPPQAPRYSATG